MFFKDGSNLEQRIEFVENKIKEKIGPHSIFYASVIHNMAIMGAYLNKDAADRQLYKLSQLLEEKLTEKKTH